MELGKIKMIGKTLGKLHSWPSENCPFFPLREAFAATAALGAGLVAQNVLQNGYLTAVASAAGYKAGHLVHDYAVGLYHLSMVLKEWNPYDPHW